MDSDSSKTWQDILDGKTEVLKEITPKKAWDPDDKDLAMILIAGICLLGSVILAFVGEASASIGSLLTGGVTALGALATGRKKQG